MGAKGGGGARSGRLDRPPLPTKHLVFPDTSLNLSHVYRPQFSQGTPGRHLTQGAAIIDSPHHVTLPTILLHSFPFPSIKRALLDFPESLAGGDSFVGIARFCTHGTILSLLALLVQCVTPRCWHSTARTTPKDNALDVWFANERVECVQEQRAMQRLERAHQPPTV